MVMSTSCYFARFDYIHYIYLKRNSNYLFVLCFKVCGLFVRETVISGDKMKLDHVSASCFPTFLSNTQGGVKTLSKAELRRRFFKDFMHFLNTIDSYWATQD